VHGTIGCHRLRRGRESLPEHLAAKDCAPPEVLARATKEVPVDSLEREEIDEVLEERVHLEDLLPDR
jgi:hypothetical protein